MIDSSIDISPSNYVPPRNDALDERPRPGPKVEMLDDKLHACESILIALSKKTNRTLRELLERTVCGWKRKAIRVSLV